MTSPVVKPPTCPPSPAAAAPDLARRFVDDTFAVWKATATGLTDYWLGALERRATPFDLMADALRWTSLATDRRPPTWSSPNRIVFETPVSRLRDFSQGSDDDVVPTLVLPPQAGHDSCIVDYSDRQSQMQVIRAAGLTRAFCLDWVGATPETKNAGVEDYLASLERAIDHIGGPVNLVGDCQGGWFATIYAALHPERVHTLTIAGAPIDFHAGDAVIHDYVRHHDRNGDLAFYEQVVALGGGVLKGEFMLNGFITMKPDSEVEKQLGLLANLHEPEHVERYRAFEDWFKHTQDIPGAFYLWIVEHLFRDNKLIRGELEIGGELVDLSRIGCPLYLLGGETDHITPPAQVFAAADHVSTPAEQITRRTTSGGHLGLFMGSEALREHWPPLLASVFEASRADAEPAPAARRARRSTPPRHTAPIPAP